MKKVECQKLYEKFSWFIEDAILVINNENGLIILDKTQAIKGTIAHHVWFWHKTIKRHSNCQDPRQYALNV